MGGPKSGTKEWDLFDPASLAMELLVARSGEVEGFRFHRGGPLYLVGKQQLFWEMVVYFKLTGSCCPPLRPLPLAVERGPLLLDDTVAGQAIKGPVRSMRRRGARGARRRFITTGRAKRRLGKRTSRSASPRRKRRRRVD